MLCLMDKIILKYDWKKEVAQCLKKKKALAHLTDDYIAFFEKAFVTAQLPEIAWFGIQNAAMSLVVGNIYLAALNFYGDSAGIWMLASQDPAPHEGFDYRIVKSTKKSDRPLRWIHGYPFECIKHLNQSQQMWMFYREASGRVLESSSSIKADETQIAHGKHRLSDILDNRTQSDALNEVPNEKYASKPKISDKKEQSELEIQNIEFENKIQIEIQENQIDPHMSAKARQERLENASKKPSTTSAMITVYNRNPDVVIETLERAKGVCERCKQAAPFNRKGGSPYLEVHHIVLLSKQGDDTVDNAIALCPNCHREAHYGENYERYKEK